MEPIKRFCLAIKPPQKLGDIKVSSGDASD
jgi:hypothetical protein